MRSCLFTVWSFSAGCSLALSGAHRCVVWWRNIEISMRFAMNKRVFSLPHFSLKFLPLYIIHSVYTKPVRSFFLLARSDVLSFIRDSAHGSGRGHVRLSVLIWYIRPSVLLSARPSSYPSVRPSTTPFLSRSVHPPLCSKIDSTTRTKEVLPGA